MTINRRTFSAALVAGAAASLTARGTAATAAAIKSRNVVLVHGLFADAAGLRWHHLRRR